MTISPEFAALLAAAENLRNTAWEDEFENTHHVPSPAISALAEAISNIEEAYAAQRSSSALHSSAKSQSS